MTVNLIGLRNRLQLANTTTPQPSVAQHAPAGAQRFTPPAHIRGPAQPDLSPLGPLLQKGAPYQESVDWAAQFVTTASQDELQGLAKYCANVLRFSIPYVEQSPKKRLATMNIMVDTTTRLRSDDLRHEHTLSYATLYSAHEGFTYGVHGPDEALLESATTAHWKTLVTSLSTATQKALVQTLINCTTSPAASSLLYVFNASLGPHDARRHEHSPLSTVHTNKLLTDICMFDTVPLETVSAALRMFDKNFEALVIQYDEIPSLVFRGIVAARAAAIHRVQPDNLDTYAMQHIAMMRDSHIDIVRLGLEVFTGFARKLSPATLDIMQHTMLAPFARPNEDNAARRQALLQKGRLLTHHLPRSYIPTWEQGIRALRPSRRNPDACKDVATLKRELCRSSDPNVRSRYTWPRVKNSSVEE